MAGAQLSATLRGGTAQDRLRTLLVVAAALVGALVVLLAVVAAVHGVVDPGFLHHGPGGFGPLGGPGRR